MANYADTESALEPYDVQLPTKPGNGSSLRRRGWQLRQDPDAGGH